MLVLSRNEGEGVTFPDLDLEVKLLKIGGNRVQIGIEASPKIRALRSELAPKFDSRQMNTSKTSAGSQSRNSSLDFASLGSCSAVEQQIDHLQKVITNAQQQLDLARKQLHSGNNKRAEESLRQIPSFAILSDKILEPPKKYALGSPDLRPCIRLSTPCQTFALNLENSSILGFEGRCKTAFSQELCEQIFDDVSVNVSESKVSTLVAEC